MKTNYSRVTVCASNLFTSAPSENVISLLKITEMPLQCGNLSLHETF